MQASMRLPAVVLLGACAASVTLYGVSEGLLVLYARDDPPYLVGLLAAFILPLLAAIVPTAVLAWLVIRMASPWHEGKLLGLSGLVALLATSLYALGTWLQSLYGLDPPYALFFSGWAMQLVGIMMPFALLLWACTSAVVRRRRRTV